MLDKVRKVHHNAKEEKVTTVQSHHGLASYRYCFVLSERAPMTPLTPLIVAAAVYISSADGFEVG